MTAKRITLDRSEYDEMLRRNGDAEERAAAAAAMGLELTRRVYELECQLIEARRSTEAGIAEARGRFMVDVQRLTGERDAAITSAREQATQRDHATRHQMRARGALSALDATVREYLRDHDQHHGDDYFHGDRRPFRLALDEALSAASVAVVRTADTITDGFGSTWERCGREGGCGLEVVRPGKVQCDDGHPCPRRSTAVRVEEDDGDVG